MLEFVLTHKTEVVTVLLALSELLGLGKYGGFIKSFILLFKSKSND